MILSQTGYGYQIRGLGGLGKLRLSVGLSNTCRLEPLCTDTTPDGYSYISLGGFRIGTSTYGQGRAMWVYRPEEMSLDNVYETVWNGLKFEVATNANNKSFCSYTISYSSETPTSNNMIRIGGGNISVDASGRVLFADQEGSQGRPREFKEAVIGSMTNNAR